MTENLPAPAPDDSGEFILYQTEDGQTRIEVRMADETVWLTQRDMAELFQTTKQNISQHLQGIYEDGELQQVATVKKYLTVQTEGSRQVEWVCGPDWRGEAADPDGPDTGDVLGQRRVDPTVLGASAT